MRAGRELPENKSEGILENEISRQSFFLPDAGYKTSPLFNRREGIADLPLLRTIFSNRQRSLEPSFWEVINPPESLLDSRSQSQQLLSCPNFVLNRSDLFCLYGSVKWFFWINQSNKRGGNRG